MFEDSALRLLIYDEIVRTRGTPAVATLAHLIGAPLDDVRASLRRMHDAHALVLQPTGEPIFGCAYAVRRRPKETRNKVREYVIQYMYGYEGP